MVLEDADEQCCPDNALLLTWVNLEILLKNGCLSAFVCLVLPSYLFSPPFWLLISLPLPVSFSIASFLCHSLARSPSLAIELVFTGGAGQTEQLFSLQLESLDAEGWILASRSNSSVLSLLLLSLLCPALCLPLFYWHLSDLPTPFLFLFEQPLEFSSGLWISLCLAWRRDADCHSN